MTLLAPPGTNLDDLFNAVGLSGPGKALRLTSSQPLKHLKGWFAAWRQRCDITCDELARLALSLTQETGIECDPGQGAIFLDKVRDVWLHQRAIATLVLTDSNRPVLNEEGADNTEDVAIATLTMSELPVPTEAQQAQPKNHSEEEWLVRRSSWQLWYDKNTLSLWKVRDRLTPAALRLVEAAVVDLKELSHQTWKGLGVMETNNDINNEIMVAISMWIFSQVASKTGAGVLLFVKEATSLSVNTPTHLLMNMSFVNSLQQQKETKTMKTNFQHHITTGRPCRWCGRGACVERCTNCKKVWYCNAQCQKRDWKKDHKDLCKKQKLTSMDHYRQYYLQLADSAYQQREPGSTRNLARMSHREIEEATDLVKGGEPQQKLSPRKQAKDEDGDAWVVVKRRE
jgi:hypothetical protein